MERRQKICVVVKAFLEHPDYPMMELAELPEVKAAKVSRKTIPKYLTDPTIISLFDSETYNRVQKLFKENRDRVFKNGMGKMIQTKRKHLKKEETAHQFKVEKSMHVLLLSRISSRYPKMTVEQITKLYNESNDIGEALSVEYVQDCLSQASKQEVAKQISSALEQKAAEGINALDELYKK